MAHLNNFCETVHFTPDRILEPMTIDDLKSIVSESNRHNKKIRVIASLHSYNECFVCNDIVISMKNFKKMHYIRDNEFSIEAGVTIEEVIKFVKSKNLTLEYCGSYGKQTLIGAILTGTHGYARSGGLLADLVTEITMLTENGNLIVLTERDDLKMFQQVKVSLGMYGIILSVRIKTIALVQGTVVLDKIPLTMLGDNEFVSSCFMKRHCRIQILPFSSFALRVSIDNNELIEVKKNKFQILEAVKDNGFIAYILMMTKKYFPRTFISLVNRMIAYYPKHSEKRICPIDYFSLTHQDKLTIERVLSPLGEDNIEIALPENNVSNAIAGLISLIHGCKKRYYFTNWISMRFVGQSMNPSMLGPNKSQRMVYLDFNFNQYNPSSASFIRSLERLLCDRYHGIPHLGKHLTTASRQGYIKKYFGETTLKDVKGLIKEISPNEMFVNDFIADLLKD